MTARPITGYQVNAVLDAVVRVEPTDNSFQLSLLIRTIIVAAKAIGVPKRILLRELERAWDAGPIKTQGSFIVPQPVGLQVPGRS